MYKKILIALLILIFLALIGVVSYFLKDILTQFVHEKAGTTTGTPKTKKAVYTALPELGIGLSINSSAFLEITPGTPINMTVVLRNLSAEEAYRLKLKIDYYTNKASATEKQKTPDVLARWQSRLDSLAEKAVTLSSANIPFDKWITFQLKNNSAFSPLPWQLEMPPQPKENKLNLTETRIELTYFIAPDTSSSITPGTYTIKAILPAGLTPKIKKDLESNTVAFTIIPKEKASKQTIIDCALLTGDYHVQHDNFTAALSLAQQILHEKPQYIPALLLSGDAYEGLSNHESACDAYFTASNIITKEYPDEPLPPFLFEKRHKCL
ncbi:MAG: hypothetical protein A2Y62_16475 [Candidatus Fischerbacteria bacterium RBG_13_37_8]|uniref:Tetratricopeptide repeat protein n=1 Tax=Candidatus Fischerbacteria bacterium RBG_13_37_8 TaxID=1817863 RepID=A0A1F5VJA8_9BACT|nr:MAG: hypothetical protein A2Y62_16475 [Candidatus Fischerbacteria bacterium RBG_13_37_8]